MAQQTINVGAAPNDGTGTPLRTAFQYTNSNFTELYTAVGPSGNNIVVPGTATISGALTVDTTTLVVNPSGYADRVGIGTATPAAELHVVGGANFSDGTTTLRAVSSGNVAFLGTITTDPLVLRVNNIEQYRIAQLGVFTWSDGAGGTRMTLNSTGLGVGVSPTAKIHIANASMLIDTLASQNKPSIILGSAGANFGQIQNDGTGLWSLGYGASSAALGTPVLSWNSTGNVGIGVTPLGKLDVGLAGTGTPRIRFTSESDNPIIETQRYSGVASDYYGERLITGGGFYFQTAPAAAVGSQTFTTRMSLDASGNLLVGTTSVHLAAHSAFQNNASGQVTFRNTSTTAGRYFNIGMNSGSSMLVVDNNGTGVYLDYATTSWASTSDERLKDIIEPISNAVAKVGSLRSVIGKFKTDCEGTRRSFLIAQDVQSVLPEAVDMTNADAFGVRYSEVIPLLVAAIKELAARVQTLETR